MGQVRESEKKKVKWNLQRGEFGTKLSITKAEVVLNHEPNKQTVSETQQTWHARKVPS